jgi:selenocysteine-specific elongation factor
VRVHLASAEVLARVRLLGTDRLEGGSSGLAQLRLESRAVAGRGDRLILRSYSPADTVGGAVVVDALPPRRRASDLAAVERLRAATGLTAALGAMAEQADAGGVDAAHLAARLTVPLSHLRPLLGDVPEAVTLATDPPVLVSRAVLTRLAEEALATLERHHAAHPLAPGIPREELRSRVFAAAPVAAYEWVLEDLARAGKVRLAPDVIASAGHRVELSADEEEARRTLLEAAKGSGLAGVEVKTVAEESHKDARLLERVARVLSREGVLGRVGPGLLVHPEHLESLKQQVRQKWPPGSRLDVAAFKEMTGLSRKYVIPLLEYLDRERVTRRSGNDRVVLS